MWRCAGVAGLVLFSACAAPVKTYPDRSAPLRAYETFVQAWRDGDVDEIERAYSATPLQQHRDREAALGREGIREWYRADAGRIEFGDPSEDRIGRNYSSISVPVVIGGSFPEEAVFRFDFVREGDEWKLFGIGVRSAEEPRKEDAWQNP